ncbi:MAG: type II toxin-antitoxin system VapB family antitoxin [bacterium]
MKTTLDIPEELIKEAQKVSGARTKTTTVCLALQEYIRMKKMNRLLDYRGKIEFDLDTKKIRKEREMR